MDYNIINSPYLPKVKFEAIPIKDLISNQDYQRNLSEKHVMRAAANFDIHQINPVKVSRRNGINYVFNGQHTMEIVATISGSRDTPVWCMVYEDLEYKVEAEIFANQQKYVKTLTPYEIFLAKIEAGSDKHLLIKDIVEQYNLELTYIPKPCGIMAVSALESIYDKFGPEVLSRTLRLSIGAWEGNYLALGANVLKGIARLLVVYKEEINDQVFAERLGNISIKEIIRSAQERKGGVMGFAESLALGYNNQKKLPLNIHKLYDRSIIKEATHVEDQIKDAFAKEAKVTDEQN